MEHAGQTGGRTGVAFWPIDPEHSMHLTNFSGDQGKEEKALRADVRGPIDSRDRCNLPEAGMGLG